MTSDVDSLVRRVRAVLAEIEDMESVDLEPLANSPLPGSGEDANARKLLRGLLRSRNVGFGSLRIYGTTTDQMTLVPALPGLFVIDLLPLPDGSFDRERVMETPVVAWKIDRGGYAEPIVPGMPVTDRWGVLTPQGYVITDQYTNLFGEHPLQLKDWIKSEIEWLEHLSGGPVREFPTAFNRMLQYGGPIEKAVGLLMASRRDWIGTSEELWTILAKVDDDFIATKEEWFVRPEIFTAALKELEPKLADADLSIAWVDDGRILIGRTSREGASEKGFPLSAQ